MVSDRIGYRHPPKSSKFRKGKSGNPKGRPKGSRSLASIVAHAIQERVVITENGHRRRVTKLDVAIKQLVNKAVTGDFKSLRELLRLVQIVIPAAPGEESTQRINTEADHKVMEALRIRILRSLEGGSDGNVTK